MDYHIPLNISDVSLMFWQITVFLLISIIVNVLPPWVVDVVGDMVTERVADPFGSAPYVDSLFEGDTEKN